MLTVLETSPSRYVLTYDNLQLFTDFFTLSVFCYLVFWLTSMLLLLFSLARRAQRCGRRVRCAWLVQAQVLHLFVWFCLFLSHSLSASAVCYMLSWQCVLALPLAPFCIGCHLFCQLHFSISNRTACVCSVSCCKFSRVTHSETHSHQHTHNGPYKHTNAHSPPWQAFRQ